MPPYLTTSEFKLESTMPAAFVDELEAIAPGYLARKLETTSASIDSRLAKRYAVPFASPYPLAIQRWLAAIVTVDCYLKRGIDPNDPQWPALEAAAERANAELAEAANSDTGLFDLPLRADSTASGVTRGGPMCITSADPYRWRDDQKTRALEERRTGGAIRRG